MDGPITTVLELHRRRVFRGIGYYLVGAWTLLQVAELVIEPAGLPAWTMSAMLYLAAVGFPLAVWLAWRYELTDKGLVRTRTATAADSKLDYSLKATDYIVFAALVAVIGAIAWQGLSNIRTQAVETQARVEAEAETEREAVENSVAVLPFSDLSQDADQAYFGEGIADTILHVLSKVNGLTVSARTSSFAFRDRGLTIEEIAGELGVAHVLEGSVQRAGNQLRIIARLIDARNSRELWSGNFDREPDEIFAVQDEIALEVVAALEITVLDDDRERLEKEYQPDLQAYEQYVLGKRELDAGTVTGSQSAKRRFEKAIEIDPDYAVAYTALARAIRKLSVAEGGSFADLRGKERPLIEKALDLNPALSEAWNLKSSIQAEDHEFEAAGKSIQTALELNPNSAEAWAGYWNFLLLMDKPEEALVAIRKASELDPESHSYQSTYAQQLFNLSRAEEAIYVLRENVRRHPEVAKTYLSLARFLNQMGRPGEALWYLQNIHRRDPGNMLILYNICLQYWQLWDNPGALDCLDQYLEANPQQLDIQKWVAFINEDFEEVIRIGEAEVAQSPQHWYPKLQLSDALAQVGRWKRIIELVEAAFPDLLAPEPLISDWNQWGARRLAEALLKSGQVERGNVLINATLDFFERSRKLQAGGWTSGTEDALLFAVRGENERALDTLERAIARGWMFYAPSILLDSGFSDLQDDPRFLVLIEKLKENMARERQWYEEHKDQLVL